MKLISLILGWFGGGPLGQLIDGLNKAYETKLNAKTEQDRIAADRDIAFYQAAIADTQNARASARTFPLWISIPGGMVAFSFAVHITLIGIGTYWVAPHDWSDACKCYVAGTGWLEFTRHIPLYPSPLDAGQLQFLAYLFGGGLLAGGVIGGAKAIAGAISRRK